MRPLPTWLVVAVVLFVHIAHGAGHAAELLLGSDRMSGFPHAPEPRSSSPVACTIERSLPRGGRRACEAETADSPTEHPDLSAVRLHALGGATFRTDGGTSYGLLVGIDHQITDFVSLELDYSNEGHFPDSHRDRIAMPIFLTARPLDDRLRLRVGVGPSFFSDSTAPEDPDDFDEQHGFSVVADAGVEILLGWGTYLEARVRGTKDFEGSSVVQALVGLSRELPQPDERSRKDKPWTVTVAGGRSVRVGGTAPGGTAFLATVSRKKIVSLLGAAAGYARLGNVDGRQGGFVAPTVSESFLSDGQLLLELAAGPYFYADSSDNGQPKSGVEGAFLARVGYRIVDDWEVSATIGRFAAFSGEGDSDLVAFGLGYEF